MTGSLATVRILPAALLTGVDEIAARGGVIPVASVWDLPHLGTGLRIAAPILKLKSGSAMQYC